MKITIKEIAQMAGVSVATVSRVINNHPQGVSQAKREEILEIVKQYNYTPNLIAKSMITNKTECIGLLVPDILNPFFQNLARGIEDYAIEYGYNVFLCNTDNKPHKYIDYIRTMIGKSVDGLILTGYSYLNIQDELAPYLENAKVVSVDHYMEDSNFCQIITDNYESAYNMTKYLIGEGHKRIACITGPSHLYVTKERMKGYQKALEECGIAFDETLIREGNFELEAGAKEAEWVMNHTDATVIFCFNDFMAQGVYKICRKLGKVIGEDISLVGFDDIYTAELMSPPLTTIKQPNYEIGKLAAKLLVDWIAGDYIPKEPINFGNELVIRESVKRIN